MDQQHNILEAIKVLAVEQARLTERIDAQLRSAAVTTKDIEKIKEEIRILPRLDIFMKASIWVYTFIISGLGVKYFSSIS